MKVNPIGKKRLEAILTISGYAAGDGAISALPSADGDFSKQIAITTSDILMYSSIWKVYFEETLTAQDLQAMLVELGLVTVAAAGTAYLVSQGTNFILRRIIGWLGPIGWWGTALVSGSLAGLFGMAWMAYCDRRFQDMHPEFSLEN